STRRQRLEYALTLEIPYNNKTVKFSDLQEQVEQIIAKLSIDDGSGGEEEFDHVKTQQQRLTEAQGFAEQTMREIEEAEQENLPPQPTQNKAKSTMATKAAIKPMEPQCKVKEEICDDENDTIPWIVNEDESLAQAQIQELLENNIQAMNEACVDSLLRWERCKRKALDLLTIEIEKVQTIESDDDATSSSEEQSLSPKSNEDIDSEEKENEIADDDDEEYVPHGKESTLKRKRAKKTMVTSTPKFVGNFPPFEFDTDTTTRMVKIGPNGTQIKRAVLEAINWTSSGPAITRKLLCEIFDRGTLAHHTLSGKPSPAFKDCARPIKQQLDPLKVADLVYLMTNIMTMTPREVRTAITTKCADENKMLRTRKARSRS
ncbi:hypothetical protein KR222_002779, partial [Zaprionus bogoriensis]